MDTYQAWQEYCKKSDDACEEYRKRQEKCPLCDHPLAAWWNYDGDYHSTFKIECTWCSFSVRGSTLIQCLDDLHYKDKYENQKPN